MNRDEQESTYQFLQGELLKFGIEGNDIWQKTPAFVNFYKSGHLLMAQKTPSKAIRI